MPDAVLAPCEHMPEKPYSRKHELENPRGKISIPQQLCGTERGKERFTPSKMPPQSLKWLKWDLGS